MTARRQFTDDKIVIASHNSGKVREIEALLAPFDVAVSSASELNLPEPEETGETFVENAEIKARAISVATDCPVLADDSGLCVDVLGGAPGVYSARWAGPDRDFDIAMQKIMEATADFETCKAHFVSVLCLCWPDGHTETFEGTVHGHLSWPARGDQGFGYDPIFVPDGHLETFAQMDPAKKHAMSHRADAFNQMVTACFQQA
jgi:XTP/dITP diphosphohydrolase